MKKIATYLVNYKLAFFIGAIIVFGLSIVFSPVPHLDGSLTGFELENNEHFENYKKADSIFGSELEVYVHLVPLNDDKTTFFKSIRELSKEIKASFPGVSISSPYTFYTNMNGVFSKENNSLKHFFTQGKEVPILSQLIAKDCESCLLLVQSSNSNKFSTAKFDSLINKDYSGFKKISPFSIQHIQSSIERYITKDIIMLTLLIAVFFLLYVIVVFRSYKSVIYTLVLVGISIGISLSLFGVLNMTVNLISLLVIPIVLILSLSDALHLQAGYIKLRDIECKEKRMQKVIEKYLIPSVFSSATTAAAFFSFYLFNDSAFIKEFGLVTAIALMLEVVFAFSLSPFLLMKFNPIRVFDKHIIGVSTHLIRIKKPVAIVFLFMLGISILVFNKLEFKSSNEIFFPSNSEISKTHDVLRENFASNLGLDIFIQAENINSPAPLKQFNKTLTSRLKQEKSVVFVNSSANQFLFRTKLGNYVDLFKVMGKKNPYYDSNKNVYHIEARFASADQVVKFQKERLDSLLMDVPQGVKITYSSLAILTDEVNKSVSASLLKSLFTSGLIILLMIFILTRSFKTALFSLAPNIVPIGIVALLFYLFHVPLNIITAITGVICLGLLDDDTVHILYRRLWLKEPMEELSFSILSSATLLIAGFSLFTLSSFQPIRTLGWVSALIFFVGVLCELTLMHWVLDYAKSIRKNEI